MFIEKEGYVINMDKVLYFRKWRMNEYGDSKFTIEFTFDNDRFIKINFKTLETCDKWFVILKQEIIKGTDMVMIAEE